MSAIDYRSQVTGINTLHIWFISCQ